MIKLFTRKGGKDAPEGASEKRDVRTAGFPAGMSAQSLEDKRWRAAQKELEKRAGHESALLRGPELDAPLSVDWGTPPEKKSVLTAALERLTRRFVPVSNVTGLTGTVVRGTDEPKVDRFSQVMSVSWYAPENGVFFLNDGERSPLASLGVVFELTPALAPDSALAEGFERLFSGEMPGPAVYSVTTFASSASVRSTLREYVESRTGNVGQKEGAAKLTQEACDVLREMAVRRARMMDERARSLTGDNPACVRHLRVWLSVVCTVGQAELLGMLEAGESPALTDFLRAAAAIEASLKQFGLFAYRWDARDWVATVRELVNPHKAACGLLEETTLAGHAARRTLADEILPESLRSAAVHPDTLIDVGRDSILFSASHPAGIDARGNPAAVPPVQAVGMAVTGLPTATHLWVMRRILGSESANRARIRTPFVWTTSVMPTPVAADRSMTAVRHARVRQLSGTEIGQFLTDLTERERDLALALKSCEEGRGLCRCAQSIVVYAAAGEGMGAAHNVSNVLASLGYHAYVDAGLQIMDLMANLPMEAGSSLMRDIKTAGRAYTVTREAASHMLPVAGDWRGSPARSGEATRKPMLMLAARSGELMPLDIFANRNGNYNAVVAGTSGSGKSVLAQDLVTSVLATGGRVWVFDIGKSYENCVELAGGQFIDFEKPSFDTDVKGRLCLNPLDMMGEDPAETLDEVAQIIAAMANGTAPMEMTAMELVKGAIASVVRKARAKGKVPQISDLVLELTSTRDPMLHDVAVRLSPFAEGGRFGAWFAGKASVNFDAALVVLEMESLTNRPVLQSVVLLILIMRILQEIRTRPRSEKKLIVIDEAWRLLTGEAASFIEWACRTLRKYGAGIVCISQSMEDFRMSGTARAVRANADSVFLLRQKPEGIASYTADPGLQKLLSGLTTVSEVYSEVWAKVGDAPGVVGRLVLDPFSMTAYSTRADVFEAVRAERARGRSTVEAIEIVSGLAKPKTRSGVTR